MVLCSAVLLFRRAKKDATLGEVNFIALLRGAKLQCICMNINFLEFEHMSKCIPLQVSLPEIF